MSTFTGFHRDHFSYFVFHADDKVRRKVHDQMRDFGDCVLPRLREFDRFYEQRHVGKSDASADYCWVAFGRGPTIRQCYKFAHQTISISAKGLRMFINIQTKAGAKRLKDTLNHHEGEFRKALQALGKDLQSLRKRQHLHDPRYHELESFELELAEVFGTERPMQTESTPKMRLHSSMLADKRTGGWMWTSFAETAKNLRLLYCSIGPPHIPPEKLIGLSEDKAVELVVETFKRHHAVVELLNRQWPSPAD